MATRICDRTRLVLLGLTALLISLLLVLTWLALPPGNRAITPQEAERLKEQTVIEQGAYGEPLPWEEVRTIFPRYTTACLVDVETGLRLEVTRRGGTYHADVQPLTALDSQIFSDIYQGKQSWRRRAVIVETGLRRIAGSINGMPHGSGKIAGNEMRGHFCVHFLNCRVHASSKVDTAHQMMVWKAAGRPEEPFLRAGPAEVINLVITALDQGDGGLASLGLSASEAGIWLLNRNMLGQMPRLTLTRSIEQTDPEEPNGVPEGSTGDTDGDDPVEFKKYRISLTLNGPGNQGQRKRSGEVTVFWGNAAGRWLVEAEDLKSLLDDD